ncbi:pyridine nucleotide-disulfide oxidoreductase [Frigoribacterium sp. Leaf164]|uniref:NAD(P)-binding domain-containing protein n=1 Tax=Frigoribacterium sp. Leaf164 TaxID=1736282 RepID=UPI0006FFA419|nr:NAD(P)-binding domain-containing protein [Frigoribacterium sp. Leaf164]KQR44624.1 pyridine nucleotide-disulfide oxidoreductase [Frigoribacterium sp. Leaf164]
MSDATPVPVRRRSPTARRATVVAIGAGQAGLSAAHHLARRGFGSALDDPDPDPHPEAADDDERTLVVLDADDHPGGAWQHRWESLRMGTVNGIFDLPGMPLPPVDPDEPSRDAVPRYFAAYEERERLPIVRPVRVTAVRAVDDDPGGDLLVETSAGTWLTRAVVNATGTWNTPVVPDVPGRELFAGLQRHSRDYGRASDFAGRRVAIVGGGISAVQLLEEVSRVATTLWYTRREPVFLDHDFTQSLDGVDVERRVAADAAEGRPPASIVSYTGLGWTSYAVEARRRGVLTRRPMFTALGPHHVVEADGSSTSVDAVIWATGFRADLDHLDPLRLRGPLGGVPLVGTRARADERVHLIGYGPSQSTVGANRAGRAAAIALVQRLGAGTGAARR